MKCGKVLTPLGSGNEGVPFGARNGWFGKSCVSVFLHAFVGVLQMQLPVPVTFVTLEE